MCSSSALDLTFQVQLPGSNIYRDLCLSKQDVHVLSSLSVQHINSSDN